MLNNLVLDKYLPQETGLLPKHSTFFFVPFNRSRLFNNNDFVVNVIQNQTDHTCGIHNMAH